MRKLNKKGFTLVEIVIVIVIIAILAAMLVPALTQWIDKSKKKTFTSACGTIKTAVWAQAAESYAIDGTYKITWSVVGNDVGKPVSNTTIPTGGYKVSNLNYSGDRLTVEDATFTGNWDGSKWVVEKKSAS